MADHMKAHDHRKSGHPDKRSAHESFLHDGFSTGYAGDEATGYNDQDDKGRIASQSHSNRQPQFHHGKRTSAPKPSNKRPYTHDGRDGHGY